MANKDTKYYFKKKGLQIFIYSKKSNQQKCRLIASPDFVELLTLVVDDKNNFNYDLWNKLSQTEKNFMYKISELCFNDDQKNKLLEVQHLKETQNLLNRLKLLEGSMAAGNYGDNIIKETINIIEDLVDRNVLTKLVGSKMINQVKKINSD
jgi:hypothetical protein